MASDDDLRGRLHEGLLQAAMGAIFEGVAKGGLRLTDGQLEAMGRAAAATTLCMADLVDFAATTSTPADLITRLNEAARDAGREILRRATAPPRGAS